MPAVLLLENRILKSCLLLPRSLVVPALTFTLTRQARFSFPACFEPIAETRTRDASWNSTLDDERYSSDIHLSIHRGLASERLTV